MYKYSKGNAQIWASETQPPKYGDNILWLRLSSNPNERFQLLYWNQHNAKGQWEIVTPGYTLFDDVRGIATPGTGFQPTETDDYLCYIGSGAGVYENFIQSNGRPITIESDTSIVLLYKDKGSKYWTYREIEVAGPSGESAYEAAVKGGYTGTKEQFYLDLAGIPNKVDKIDGKGLSTNDYTNGDKDKLINLAKIYKVAGVNLSLNPISNTLEALDQIAIGPNKPEGDNIKLWIDTSE